MSKAKILNFKCDGPTYDYLLRGFRCSGVVSFSEWARAGLTLLASREIRLADEAVRQSEASVTIRQAKARAAQDEVSRASVKLGRGITVTGDCVHPPQMRVDLPFEVRCGLCSHLVRSKLGQGAA